MGELRERMRADMVVRGYSESTIRTYVDQVKCFARHFGRCPSTMGEDEIRTYQLHLAERPNLSVGYKCMFVTAVKYFYGNILGRPEVTLRIKPPKRPRPPSHGFECGGGGAVIQCGAKHQVPGHFCPGLWQRS